MSVYCPRCGRLLRIEYEPNNCYGRLIWYTVYHKCICGYKRYYGKENVEIQENKEDV
jgi:hypothetical protein